MNKSAAGWHDNSPHSIIRIDGPLDFRKWDRKCLAKNWPGVQEVKEGEEVKELKENAVELA
jgi:hypothetical protein